MSLASRLGIFKYIFLRNKNIIIIIIMKIMIILIIVESKNHKQKRGGKRRFQEPSPSLLSIKDGPVSN